MGEGLDLSATVIMPSNSLISVTVAVTSYDGAHPNTQRFACLAGIDGAPITEWKEVFANDPSVIVYEALRLQAKQNGVIFFDEFATNVTKLVNDLRYWSFAKGFATLLVDPYAIAAYSYGPQDVDIGYEALAPYITKAFHEKIQ